MEYIPNLFQPSVNAQQLGPHFSDSCNGEGPVENFLIDFLRMPHMSVKISLLSQFSP